MYSGELPLPTGHKVAQLFPTPVFVPSGKGVSGLFLSPLAGVQEGGVREMIKGSEKLPSFYSFAARS